jgi:hypothetical protein
LDFKFDAGDLRAAVHLTAVSALTKLGDPDVTALVQVDPGGDQHAVDVKAGLSFELKQLVYYACIVGAST